MAVNLLKEKAPLIPEMRLSTGFLSYPERGNGGKSNWRGNFSPKLVEDLVLQFEPRKAIDPAVGSGTSKEIFNQMGVNNVCLDLNPKWGSFDLVNDEMPESADLIVFHPPYWDMVTYSGKEWGKADHRDLSRAGTWEQFITLLNKCTAKLISALRKNGRMAVLVGDIKKQGHLYSMLKSMDWYGKPENVVPKFQHNASSFKTNYGKSNFIPITCEYLLILKREDCYVIKAMVGRGIDIDLRKSKKVTWRNVVHAALEKLGGKSDLDSLYREVEDHEKTKGNPNWQAKVRQVLQETKDFVSLTRGVWGFDY